MIYSHVNVYAERSRDETCCKTNGKDRQCSHVVHGSEHLHVRVTRNNKINNFNKTCIHFVDIIVWCCLRLGNRVDLQDGARTHSPGIVYRREYNHKRKIMLRSIIPFNMSSSNILYKNNIVVSFLGMIT